MRDELMCFRCLVAYQTRDTESLPRPAYVVYGGESLCYAHANTERGWPADMTRYPREEDDEG